MAFENTDFGAGAPDSLKSWIKRWDLSRSAAGVLTIWRLMSFLGAIALVKIRVDVPSTPIKARKGTQCQYDLNERISWRVNFVLI